MEIVLLIGLLFKHFITDFILQTSYQYKNKGIYGHPGGLLHAGIHTIGSLAVLSFFLPLHLAVILALADGAIHYHIDWGKETISRRYHLKDSADRRYWFMFGLDQFLHQMTYIGLTVAAQMLTN